jgi:hypothetical protein
MSLQKIFWRGGTAIIATGALALSAAGMAEGVSAAPVFSGASEVRVSTDYAAAELPASGVSSSVATSETASAALPDAPSTTMLGAPVGFESMAAGGQNSPVQVAPIYTKYIPGGWTAQHINAGDKVIIGFRDIVNPFSLAGIVVSAGYSHVTNGQPNYGTNGKAFGKRLGAIALRDTTEGLFTDTVFAPIFHQDPRYYVKGQGHSFVSRLVYAATRPLITRTDGGRETINASLLAGYASSAALADAYFPQINRNFKDTASDFGGSIGGAALGDLVAEFYDDFAVAIHIKKAQ